MNEVEEPPIGDDAWDGVRPWDGVRVEIGPVAGEDDDVESGGSGLRRDDDTEAPEDE
jgi:hypothetical protein